MGKQGTAPLCRWENKIYLTHNYYKVPFVIILIAIIWLLELPHLVYNRKLMLIFSHDECKLTRSQYDLKTGCLLVNLTMTSQLQKGW